MTVNKKQNESKKQKDLLIIILLLAMIAIPLILVIGGAIPAIWESIIKLLTAVVPSWKTLLAILWAFGLGTLAGVFCARLNIGK